MSDQAAALLSHRRTQVEPASAVRLLTIQQTEARHPALSGRLRSWIHKADAGHPDYLGLRRAIVRVGRSLFLNEIALDEWLAQCSAMPPAPSRNSRSQCGAHTARLRPIDGHERFLSSSKRRNPIEGV